MAHGNSLYFVVVVVLLFSVVVVFSQKIRLRLSSESSDSREMSSLILSEN